MAEIVFSETVSYEIDGRTGSGYLALPDGRGPGVVLIQEWWGLVPHIKDVAQRLAREGFVTLAPDLYGGKTTTEPSEASKLMMALQIQSAARDMETAYDYLRSHESVDPPKIGSIGFCMGGALSLYLATLRPLDACVVYYGIPYRGEPDYSQIVCPVLGHFAEFDQWASEDAALALKSKLDALGKRVEFYFYPRTRHAFFNDSNEDSYDPEAAQLSWQRTLEFLRKNLL
ncbi:MAG: carboxymethylenebutenolidase [Acidimicrobiia bacterium]